MKRFALTIGLLATLGCQKPAADLREWKPQDHSNTTNAAAQAKQSDGKASPAPAGLDEVTIATWSAKCVLCHGRIGKGDGPQAAMFQPRDLTDPAWQASVSDQRIAEVIQKGFNKMPGFALPEPTLSNMVQLIRRLNANPSGARPVPSGATTAVGPSASSASGTSPPPARSARPHP
jgi:Cytochrome C oxidase, cbb3-type, subunit III